MKPTILPTLLTNDSEEIQAKINKLSEVTGPLPFHFQVDIIDGFYADNLTIMPETLKTIDWKNYTFEVHLMVNDPEDYLGEVADAGATGIIAQIEHMHDREDYLKVARSLNLKAGLALDLYSPITELTTNDLLYSDIILLMAVKAGFSGQTFNPLVHDKIKELRARGYSGAIEIDGGVDGDSIPKLIDAGATHLAVNSALWHDNKVEENLLLLNKVLQSA